MVGTVRKEHNISASQFPARPQLSQLQDANSALRRFVALRTCATIAQHRFWTAAHHSMGRMRKGKQQLRWLERATLVTALVAVLLMASGVTLLHWDAPGSEATCSICHVAHMPALPGVFAGTSAVLAAGAWIVPVEIQVSHATPCTLDSPPRAPPA